MVGCCGGCGERSSLSPRHRVVAVNAAIAVVTAVAVGGAVVAASIIHRPHYLHPPCPLLPWELPLPPPPPYLPTPRMARRRRILHVRCLEALVRSSPAVIGAVAICSSFEALVRSSPAVIGSTDTTASLNYALHYGGHRSRAYGDDHYGRAPLSPPHRHHTTARDLAGKTV